MTDKVENISKSQEPVKNTDNLNSTATKDNGSLNLVDIIKNSTDSPYLNAAKGAIVGGVSGAIDTIKNMDAGALKHSLESSGFLNLTPLFKNDAGDIARGAALGGAAGAIKSVVKENADGSVIKNPSGLDAQTLKGKVINEGAAMAGRAAGGVIGEAAVRIAAGAGAGSAGATAGKAVAKAAMEAARRAYGKSSEKKE